MRVLIAWGSKRGGTEGIARTLGDELSRLGFDVELSPASEVRRGERFDAVIVGGALYAGLWHRAARSFVARCAVDLRTVPVWFFSSGPLDDSASHDAIPPTPQVAMLMERVGALGHATFGGRLAPDAKGFPASAIARKHAGDWRSDAQIRAWARDLARALPSAKPGRALPQEGGGVVRLAAHAVVGWAACAATMGILLHVASPGIAFAVHAIAAPLIFAPIARHYFRPHGARGALPTAAAFAGIVALLDLVFVAGLAQGSLAMFGSVAGTWLPLALIFGVTWAVGEVIWIAGPPHVDHPADAHALR